MTEHKGLLGSLFDLSFSELVTTKIVKLMYIVSLVMSGLITLTLVISGFADSALTGFFTLILAPILFLLYALVARIWLELIIVVFKIAENTSYLVKKDDNES